MEALHWLLLGGGHIAKLVDLDMSLCLQLLEQNFGVLVLLGQLIELSKLLLCSGQFLQLSLDVGFFLGLSLLVSLDLNSRSPSFAGLLQHVGADALAHW